MNKVLNIIGLAYRAKKTIISLENIFECVKKNKVYVCFVADLSESSMSNLKRAQDEYGFEINTDFSQEELSHALGLKNVKAVALIDKGFYELTKK